MNTLVVIPARLASTRLPGKPLALIAGKTLIRRVAERALLLPGVAAVRVAADHPDVLAEARAAGCEAVLTAVGHPSGSDRVAEAAAGWPGAVLNLQGDEPLFDLELTARLIARFAAEPGLVMGTAGVPLAAGDAEHPDRVKVLRDARGFARDFSRGPLAVGPGEELLRHAGVYLYRAPALRRFVEAGPAPRERAERLEQLRALALGMPIWVERGERWGPGVDRPEDLKVVEKLLGGV